MYSKIGMRVTPVETAAAIRMNLRELRKPTLQIMAVTPGTSIKS
jgi:hypothetical protein